MKTGEYKRYLKVYGRKNKLCLICKDTIKTLLTTTNAGSSDTQFTVRKNFVGTTNSSGVVTFSAGTNETFVGFSTVDYTLSVLTAGTGTATAAGCQLVASCDLAYGGKSSSFATPGVNIGLSRELSRTLVLQTVLGSAELLRESGMHPGQLKDLVTSPAGATIAGLSSLEQAGFRGTVINAVNSAYQKTKLLGD